MANHTPGKWHADDDLVIRVREWQRCQQMGDYRGCVIADLNPALGGESRAHARPETEANARLIAAAPELLESLETAVRWLRRLEMEYPGCLNEDAIDKHLSKAIAAAKGGGA